MARAPESRTTGSAAADRPAQPESPAATEPTVDETRAEPDAEPSAVTSDCVVNGGRGMHVGRAVNGKVCSYHAMRYHADGTPR